MAQQAHVLYCVEFDSTGTCVQQAWMPAPSLLPPLSGPEVAGLLTATAALFAVAWGSKKLGWVIRS